MNQTNQRIELAVKLLEQLLFLQSELTALKEQIEASYKDILENVYVVKLQELSEINLIIQTRAQDTARLNNSALELVNKWYQWSNNIMNKGRFFYPISYLIRKRALAKELSIINHQISQISISSRLFKEKAASWEMEVRQSAQSQILDNALYKKFVDLSSQKEQLLEDLSYLFSTVFQPQSVEINLSTPRKLEEILIELNLPLSLGLMKRL